MNCINSKETSNHFGRRIGFTKGFIAGGPGTIDIVIGNVINNIFLLFITLLIYSAGTATNLQARYDTTGLATSKQRGIAISIALVSKNT